MSWADDALAQPVTTLVTSDVIGKLEAALAIVAKPNAQQEVRLLSVDNTQEPNWRYSAAVLVVRRPQQGWLSYFPMLIEATENRPLESRSVPLGNTDRQIPVTPVPGDGFDQAYAVRIEQLLAQTYPNDKVLLVQGLVIPRTVNFDDLEPLKHILALAARSCVNQLAEIDPAFTDNNLSRVARDSSVVSRLSVTSGLNGEKRNTLGAPVRQDISLKLVAVLPQDNNQQSTSRVAQVHSLNGQGSPEEAIGEVSAYMDTRFLPAVTSLYNQDPKVATRRFVPELVISGVHLSKLATTASLMMMVTQMTVLAEPRIWHSVLYQRRNNTMGEYKGAAFDPTDLGALNYASNVAQQPEAGPYDLKSPTVTPNEFISYIDRAFVQALSISIDVPRMSVGSAFMNALSEAALGKPEALALLQASVNKLTGGKFNQLFFSETGGNGVLTADHVFSERNNSLYTGYYNQKVGNQTRDVSISHIDTVALMARYGKQEPGMIVKWAQSFMVRDIDPVIRMANKREVIAAYTNDSAVITGISDRHTFNARFLQVLVACNVQNGFQPTLEFNDPLAGHDTGLQAPVFMQNGNGLFTGGVAGSYQAGNTQTGGYGGAYLNNTASRF